jgi:LmbE family N-acetylglucosaminyl deacetylase
MKLKRYPFVTGALLASVVPLMLMWPSFLTSRLRAMPELAAEYPPLPSWETGKVLMIFAHADDELGVIAQVARLQRDNPALEVKWVLATDSGEGFTFPGRCRGLTAAECRLEEARAVARCMAVPDPVPLGLPDGGLADVPDLAGLLRLEVAELNAPDLRAVFTNDNRGLYGHADHVALHDAVTDVLTGRDVPLVSMALTETFHALLPMKEPGASRPRLPITHAYDLGPEDVELKACAFAAHASQVITLRLQMMLGVRPRDFFAAAPREFFTVRRSE